MALVLLPPPPDPPSRSAVEVAYLPPLRSTLHKLLSSPSAPSSSSTSITIDIALPCPDYILPPSSPPAKLLSLISNLYALLESIISEESQEQTREKHPLNPRVILLTYPSDVDYYTPLLTKPTPSGPSVLIDLAVLALTDRPWTRVFIVDGESGERLHRQFTTVVNSRFSARVGGTWTTERVRGGLSLRVKRLPSSTQTVTVSKTGRRISGVGGEKNAPVAGQTRRRRILVPGPFSPMTLHRKRQVTQALVLAELELGGAVKAGNHAVSVNSVDVNTISSGGGVEGMVQLVEFIRATVGINPVRVRVGSNVVTVDPFEVVCVEELADLETHVGEGETVVIGGDPGVREAVEGINSRKGHDTISLVEIDDTED